MRSTEKSRIGNTLDDIIRDISPTASFTSEPTAEFIPPSQSVSSPPNAAFTLDSADYSRSDRSKIADLASRGYRVVRKLGEGGFGVVYLAEDSTDRLVAIKMLHAALGVERYRRRFDLEAKALSRLDDSALVRLYHYDSAGAEPMLVTEFVPGGTLSQKLQGPTAYSPAEAAGAVLELARAVQLVHIAGLVHRDIKPSNILIAADGRLKLGDFGLVKRLDRDDDLTPTGRGIGGTPEYSAPEQFRDSGDCDGRADVYALGATLFRLLTGKPVFERTSRDDLVAVILRVLSEEPVPPRKLQPAIPRELEAVCLKCLAKNPANRYQSAADLAADLQAWSAGAKRLPNTRLSTLPERVWKRTRRVPKFAAAMALVLMVGIGAAVAMMRKKDPPPVVDPLVEMQNELAKDGKLVLVGERGKPRWHRFPIGGPELSESLTGDHSNSFESINVCVMELYPEAPAEHYLVRADLRFAATRIGSDAGEPPFGGLFSCGEKTFDPGNDKIGIYSLSGLYYLEGREAQSTKSMRFTSARIPQRPDTLPAMRKFGLANLLFRPTEQLPGVWRTVEIEVWPNRIIPRAVIDGATENFTGGPAGGLDVPAMQAALDRQDKSLRQYPEYDNVPKPQWNPRGAVGIWAYKAAVDFKNVSVTILP